MADTYKILRYYFSESIPTETVLTGLTLEEAQRHCNDQETNSETCSNTAGMERTRQLGEWFDGYTKENR